MYVCTCGPTGGLLLMTQDTELYTYVRTHVLYCTYIHMYIYVVVVPCCMNKCDSSYSGSVLYIRKYIHIVSVSHNSDPPRGRSSRRIRTYV